jgi:hypothetical protein
MSGVERYQRLPKLAHDDDDEHEESSPLGADGALDSLVTEDNTMPRNNSSIFRSSPWTAVPDRDEGAGGDGIMETGSTAGSTTSSRRGSGGNIVSSTSPSSLNSASSKLQVMLSRSYSNDRSQSHHSGGESSDDNSDEWDDDDDDVGAVRRYHLDFEQHNRDNHNLPLPGSAGDFSHESWYSPLRVWRSFLELRITARQRRAARLLTMPSESFPYKLHACLLTTCCDATDRGILTVVGLMTAWLFLGWAGSMSAAWWWAGILLFVMRVTARRLLESCLDANRKRMRRRQRLHTSEAAALEAETGLANSTPGGLADFAASPDTPSTTTAAAGTAWGESDATTSLQHVV